MIKLIHHSFTLCFMFVFLIFQSCDDKETELNLNEFTKYKYFNEYIMKGEGEVSKEDSLLKKFVYVQYKKNGSIIVYHYYSKKINKYYFEDSLWINKFQYYDRDLGDTIVTFRYCNGKGDVINQEILMGKYSEKSHITFHTKDWYSSMSFPFKQKLKIKMIDSITNKIINRENKKGSISASDCYKCMKKLYRDYLLIYKSIEEISDAELQYVVKPRSLIKTGHLLLVYKLNGLSEYEATIESTDAFLKFYPEMEYY